MTPFPDITDALFLDFDGTLVNFAPNPAEVEVPGQLHQLLEQASGRLDGAIALITGRPLVDLDKLLSPHEYAAAGEHGAETRFKPGEPVSRSLVLPAEAAAEARRLNETLPGTLLELKTVSTALHYRNAPEHGEAAVAGMAALADRVEGYELLQGKMVAELKPSQVDKGNAVRSFMTREPFSGRRPVYIGDDVTDEAGFAAVNELSGLSVRVGGCENSAAQYSLDSVEEVLEWLSRLD